MRVLGGESAALGSSGGRRQMDSGTVRESLGIIQQPDLVHPRKTGGGGQRDKATGDIVAFSDCPPTKSV